VAPETTTSTTVPAPPKYLFEFNRTNEPTYTYCGGDGCTNGIRSGQLGIEATTSVSGTVRVDCEGLLTPDVQVFIGGSSFFSGVCNTDIAVSLPTTAFPADTTLGVIPLTPEGGIFGGGFFPAPVGTRVTFAIHSDALVPGTISL
jgi:hypothetical protein